MMLKKLKLFLVGIYIFIKVFFRSLSKGDELLTSSKTNASSGKSIIESQNEINSVYNDLIKKRVTEAVKELRHEMYFAERQSHKYSVSSDGSSNIKSVFSFQGKVENSDGNKIWIVQENIKDTDTLKEIIVDEMLIMYVDNKVLNTKIKYSEEGPTVILFVGVNGVGKTTSIGKIANRMKNAGKKVILVAGDTFRAGATEQLVEWGKRIDVPVVTTSSKDPSAAVYDGIDTAIKGEYDVVLIDTAGRLQNKVNLMNELSKMNKVIKKVIPDAPHEVLLVVDATTGQNGIQQAKAFKEVTDVSGIILTKLDGSAKGGIVLAIKEEVDIPVKFVGLGEGTDDLEPFDIEKYIYGLFKDL